jgi:pimeloyl-ACP methyl ester carboxylesterase
VSGFESRILRRDGLRLRLYLQQGEGPVAFLQHGLCGDANQSAAAFPADSGARLAVLECRGHGESEAGPHELLSLAAFADDLSAAIRQSSAVPCILGGISMGAALSLRIACREPGLVSGLVLVRPAWIAEPAPENMAPNLVVGRFLSVPPVPGEREAFLACESGRRLAAEAPDNLASLLGFFQREPRAVTAALLTRISLDGPGITESELSALTVPTLVIGHDDDIVHPWHHAQRLAAIIPGARLAKIPSKARSKPAYEDALRNELRRFIKETSDATSRNRLV